MRILILFFLFLSLTLQAHTLPLNINKNYDSIGAYLHVYEDSSATQSYEEISALGTSKFHALQSTIDAHLPTDAVYWYRFSVQNDTSKTQTRILALHEAWLDNINIYYKDENNKDIHFQGGDTFNFDVRAVDATKINFELNIPPGIHDIYVSVQTRDPFIVNMSLQECTTFLLHHADFLQEMTFIYGVIIAMLVYNFFLFLSSRDKTYAYYVLYLVSFLLMLSSYNGLLYKYFWPNSPSWHNYSVAIFMSFYIYTGLFFANAFLQTATQHPKIYTFSKYFIVFLITTTLMATWSGGYAFTMPLVIIYSTFFSIFAVSIGLIALKQNNQSARFFLLGSIAGLLGTIITGGTALALIPYHPYTFKAIDYGVLIDAVMLSLALADKLRVLQHQKLLAQNDAKEKALASEKLKDAFLSTMSHEIRTPLNAIIGFVFILQKRLKDPHLKEYIDTIQSSSKTLLNIINDILDFSNIQNGKLFINKEPFDPYKELCTTAKLFEHTIKIKNITYIINIDEELPKTLLGDITRINQVLYNLLSNAFKFTSKVPVITLNVAYKESKLIISVHDNGTGIDANIQNKIFNAFEQAELGTTRRYGGTGLGLAISNRLAQLMQTKIELESELNKGSTFSIAIPLEVSDHNLHESSDDELSFYGHVLIVEDNRTNQLLISVLLEDYNISYEIANDGIEAVTAFEKGHFDLILMDENMPNMNGLKAFATIRLYEERQKRPPTPIVALTADVAKDGFNKYLDAGMNDYLAKPIDNNEFERVLSRFLNPRLT